MDENGAAAGPVLRRADLLAAGMPPKQITRAVREGRLLRVRRDRYMSAPRDGIDRAVRIGGRLACVSLLAVLGVFVLDDTRLHVHLDKSMSRLRSPDDHRRRLGLLERRDLALHWFALRGEHGGLAAVSLADALAQSIRCQDARSAIATIDSVLHLRLMTLEEVREVFSWLPTRYAVLLALADGSAESGAETYLRLILRQLGLQFRTQVYISGVGRVDFLVEGWLIIECDSKAHHEGWEKQREDRRRDLSAAAQGYATIRPLAEDLFYHRERVISAVRGLARSRRRARAR